MMSDPGDWGVARHHAGRPWHRLATAGLITAIVAATASPPLWAGGRSGAATEEWSAGDLSRITGPRIETTVVAMELRGPGRQDVIAVPDLDMIERGDGVRLLPLLRLLRGLGVEPRDSASILTFVPDGAPIVQVDYASGTVTIAGATASVAMQPGISDITNLPELYVDESAVAAMLAMQLEWDPRLYAYSIRANRPLRIFDRRPENAWLARRSAFASYDLPGHLPPAGAHRSFLPTLQFTEVQWFSSLSATRGDSRVQGTLGTPRVGLWADVLHGNLAARLSVPTAGSTAGYRVEQLSWSTHRDRASFSAGSVNLGLSELVFPSMSLIGAVANGRMGAQLGSEDPSQLGRQQAFMNVRVFDGYARLGSEVTLNINGQDVETKRVEPAPNSPPGDGPYRFEGVNLFSSRMNDVRIRILAPDGSVEEIRRNVLGTDLLLAAGEVAFVGGFGGRRNPSVDDWAADGRFGGGRVNLGVTRRLTGSMSAAYQDRLYGADVFLYPGSGSLIRAPSQSLHLGSRLDWQPLDPLLLSTEVARSQSLPDSGSDWAARADAEYQLGELNIHPALFRYGPRFFDGQNPDQRDLAGASVGLLWRHKSGNTLALGGSRTRDNLDDAKAEPLRANEIQAGWSVTNLIPHTTLTLGGRRIWISDSGVLHTGLLAMEGALPWGWSLRGHREFGDDIRRNLSDRLAGGSTWRFDLSNRTSSAPGVGSVVGVGSVTSAVELWRRIDEAWHVSLAHRTLGTQRRSSLDLVRAAPPGGIWQARLSPGYEWDSRSHFLLDRFELFLSRSRSNRLVFEHQIQQGEWLVRLSFQVQTQVGFAGARPVPLLGSQLDPSSGGVKGRVFLDTNGNGLADPGEPGLEGAEVVTDQGRRTLSTSGGLFVISNSSSLRRTRVSLQPEALPATYTLTQATQEAILRPGQFTEVNLGVAVLGSVSGSVVAQAALGSPSGNRDAGVSGVRVLLVNEEGQVAGYSITGIDGVFTISDIRPGRYVVRPDQATLPSDFVLESADIPVEVTAQAEPFERTGLTFTGRYTDPRTLAERVQDDEGVVYKVFSRTERSTAARAPARPSASEPVSAGPASSPLPSLAGPAPKPAPTPSAALATRPAQAEPPAAASTTSAPELALAAPSAAATVPVDRPLWDLTPTSVPAPPAAPEPMQAPPPTPPNSQPKPPTDDPEIRAPEPVGEVAHDDGSHSEVSAVPPASAGPAASGERAVTPAANPGSGAEPDRAAGESISGAATAAPHAPEPQAVQETTQEIPPGAAESRSRLRLAYGRAIPDQPQRKPEGVNCECEVEGTIEVRSDRPLSRPVLVSIAVVGSPAHRDSVELFMGPPREFRLGRVPCGSHELTIRTSSHKRFVAASTNPTTFECVADRRRELRIVLEAR